MKQKSATNGFLVVPGYSRLFRRGAIYYFRVSVPQDLRRTIGKSEIIKSLRTADFHEAKRLVALESLSADSLIDSARMKIRGDRPPVRQVAELSDVEIRRLAIERFIRLEQVLEEDYSAQGRFYDASDLEQAIENTEMDYAMMAASNEDGEQYRYFLDRSLDQFLAEKGIEVAKSSRTYQRLSEFFQRAEMVHQRRRIARYQGLPQPLDEPMFRDIHAGTLLPRPAHSVTLGELLDRFLAFIRAERSETTFSTYQTPTRVMREVLGEATRLDDITRESIDRLFELLKKRPQNTAQHYVGLTTEQAIAAAELRGDGKKLSAKSLQNYYTNVLAIFNFAVDEKMLSENPAKIRSLREEFRKREPKKKPLFTADQLSKIFHSAQYQHGFRNNSTTAKPFEGGRFFVPLLALFQGLRCNEACQLYVEDIKEERGIPFLAIREEREDGTGCEKRLKNYASKRNVPIHPTLIRAGFMNFVSERRDRDDSSCLFPELPLGKTGRYSNPFSKWFAGFLSRTFDAKPAATFHSFRHHFRDAAREGSVGIEAVERLGGWKSHASQEREYGQGLSIEMLRAEIEKIEYPHLDLSHLFVGE